MMISSLHDKGEEKKCRQLFWVTDYNVFVITLAAALNRRKQPAKRGRRQKGKVHIRKRLKMHHFSCGCSFFDSRTMVLARSL
ncbi:MAG TPA: hypothetical protein VJ969_05500, partial [Desulfopila sp.]|nr:hypothetical protein [Desulfopila sp.]